MPMPQTPPARLKRAERARRIGLHPLTFFSGAANQYMLMVHGDAAVASARNVCLSCRTYKMEREIGFSRCLAGRPGVTMDPKWQGEDMRSKRIARISRPPHCGRKAFTLIELLVVIAIIALLMAILMPGLQRVRRQAKAVKCQGTLRQWGLYYSMYTSEHDYRMPPRDNPYNPFPGVFPGNLHDAREVSKEGRTVYYGGFHGYKKLFLCPATRANRQRDSLEPWIWNGGCCGSTYGPWVGGMRQDGRDMSSYGQNGWTPSKYPVEDTSNTWVSSLVKSAGDVPVYSDCRVFAGYVGPTDSPPPCADGPLDPGWGVSVYAMDRHQGGINSLFMNWSVRKVGVKELWTLKWSPGFNTAGPWTKAGGVQPDQWPKWMQKFKDY
jgi:prepilin-type N-terminal cleavage/methylation domain-containing protein